MLNKGLRPNSSTIKSEGDLDLATPLYAMGVQGIFTRRLDMALFNDKIDLAVHSMKDVPVQLPAGIKRKQLFWRETILLIYWCHIPLSNINTRRS